MASYICERPYEGRFHLWADDANEAVGIAYAVADAPTPTELGYLLTQNEMVAALAFGALQTDWLGPARWAQEGKRDLAVRCGPFMHHRQPARLVRY